VTNLVTQKLTHVTPELHIPVQASQDLKNSVNRMLSRNPQSAANALPCVHRIWRLDIFPDIELLDLMASAWVAVGNVLSETNDRAGHNALDLSLGCRHTAQKVQFRIYDRGELKRWIK
jgi:hypothetical protein